MKDQIILKERIEEEKRALKVQKLEENDPKKIKSLIVVPNKDTKRKGCMCFRKPLKDISYENRVFTTNSFLACSFVYSLCRTPMNFFPNTLSSRKGKDLVGTSNIKRLKGKAKVMENVSHVIKLQRYYLLILSLFLPLGLFLLLGSLPYFGLC